MIHLIIDLLQSQEWLNTGSKTIEIAKGKHQLATNVKQAKRKLRRQWQSKR
jgi:hypothetical protein